MSRSSLSVSIRVVILAAVLLVVPRVVGAQPAEPDALPEQTPSALRGKSVYEARCIRCHGPEGAGDGDMTAELPEPPPSFLDEDRMRQVTPAEYFDVITNGNMQAFMPPWRDELTAQERWDVLFYVWSLSSAAESIERGERIYAEQCAECHGDTGDKVDAINLGDQATMAMLSRADLAAGITDGHSGVDWQDTLTDEERRAVVGYVRTFTYDTLLGAEVATGEGVIQGQVINGTAGADVDPTQVEITLFPFVGQTTLAPISATVQSDGTFRIENLATDPDREYGIQATYKGVDYFHSELISLSDAPSADVSVHVYETTSDASAISVDRNHIIIDFANNELQVAELYIFRNSGDRAYVGAGETLRFSLPDGAQNVTFDDPRMNASIELVEGGVVDTLPVTPGSRQVLLSYTIPYAGRSIQFQKDVVYQTDNVNVLVSDAGVDVDAGDMVAGEPVTTQSNLQFLNYMRRDVSAGGQISLELSNLPRGNTSGGTSMTVPQDRSGTLRWFGLGFVAAVFVFALAYPALRPRLLTDDELADDTSEALLRRQRQTLLEELADLDDAYDAGNVAESTYVDARAEIKADLIDIMKQLQSIRDENEESR